MRGSSGCLSVSCCPWFSPQKSPSQSSHTHLMPKGGTTHHTTLLAQQVTSVETAQ
jgi:hypothetical protein